MNKVKARPESSPLFHVGLFVLLAALLTSLRGVQKPETVEAAQQAPAIARQTIELPPLEESATLFFATNHIMPALVAAERNGSSPESPGRVIATHPLMSLPEQEQHIAKPEAGGDVHARIDNLSISPDGHRIIFHISVGPTSRAWILDLTDRAHPSLTSLTGAAKSRFNNLGRNDCRTNQ